MPIRVQDIVAQVGTSAPKVLTPAPATASACDSPQITPGPHPVRIWFIFTNAANATGNAAYLDTTIALRAPGLVGNIAVASRPRSLDVALPIDEDTSIAGYDVFCDATACGTAAGGPAPDNTFLCAQGTNLDTTIAVPQLDPKRSYTIAVAAVDQYENVGPLTNSVCATPQDVPAGSPGGGGCTVGAIGSGALTPTALALVAALGLRRRRRSGDGRRPPRRTTGT